MATSDDLDCDSPEFLRTYIRKQILTTATQYVLYCGYDQIVYREKGSISHSAGFSKLDRAGFAAI